MASSDLKDLEVLTIAEAASILRLSESKTRQLAASGELPGVLPRLGKTWRVSRAGLQRYLDTAVAETVPPVEHNAVES